MAVCLDRLSSPEGLRSAFEVSEKQYLWTQLRAKAIMGDWAGVKSLVENRVRQHVGTRLLELHKY